MRIVFHLSACWACITHLLSIHSFPHHTCKYLCFNFSFFLIFVCDLWLIYLSPPLGPRLLRSLHLGLPFLWVPDALQHGGGPGLMRRMHIRGLLLLLLHRRSGRRLQLPLWHGLWHNGCLLRVLRLPGNLHGVLRHLLPHIDRPVLVWTRAISKTPNESIRRKLLLLLLSLWNSAKDRGESVHGGWHMFSWRSYFLCAWLFSMCKLALFVQHALEDGFQHWASPSKPSGYMNSSVKSSVYCKYSICC